jgi:hypothetical protein
MGTPTRPGFVLLLVYNGVSLSGLDFSMGVQIPGDTSATGNCHCTFVGTAIAK